MLVRYRALLSLTPLLVATTVMAQGPWARVPALPTSCYAKEDNFAEELDRIRAELDAEGARQNAANRALTKQIFALDPATMQQRLMAAMQKNPSQSQQIMQSIQQTGTAESQAQTAAIGQAQTRFDEKKTKLIDDYKAERDAMLGPIFVRIRNHTTESGGTAADDEAVRTGWIEYNNKYETVLCERWFKKEVTALLAEYREHLVRDRIPKQIESESVGKRQLELFGFSSRDYHPTAEFSGAAAYLRFAYDLFNPRRSEPSLP